APVEVEAPPTYRLPESAIPWWTAPGGGGGTAGGGLTLPDEGVVVTNGKLDIAATLDAIFGVNCPSAQVAQGSPNIAISPFASANPGTDPLQLPMGTGTTTEEEQRPQNVNIALSLNTSLSGFLVNLVGAGIRALPSNSWQG